MPNPEFWTAVVVFIAGFVLAMFLESQAHVREVRKWQALCDELTENCREWADAYDELKAKQRRA